MNEVKFNCEHCGQSFKAPEDMLGQAVECPTCNLSIQIPEPEPQLRPPSTPLSAQKKASVASESTPSGSTKPCPYCGESILSTARKCKHCGEFIKGQHEVKTNVKQGAVIGAIVCFVIGIGLMFLSLWSIIIYSPLFLAAFILSIVAMSQKRVAGGLIVLLLTLIVPPVMFLGLSVTRAKPTIDKIFTPLDEASDDTADLPDLPALSSDTIDPVYSPDVVEESTDIDESPDLSTPSPDNTAPVDLTEDDEASTADTEPLSGSTPSPGTAAPVDPPGWMLSVDTSPIDDTKHYSLRRDSEEPVRLGFGSQTPRLVISQKGEELIVGVVFRKAYLGSGSIPVTIRIGSAAATEEEWIIGSGGGSVGFVADVAFIRRLLANDRLAIRFTPYGEGPVTATFDLRGLAKASESIKSRMQQGR